MKPMNHVGTTSDSRLGALLGGRYRLEARIASGGMATVYRATDETLGRPVAVKVMHSGLASDPGFVERFRREAQNAARLNHPNVVTVHDGGEHDGAAYIVMELVDGRTLRDLIERFGRLDRDTTRHVVSGVAAALDHAHTKGVVHRDVKPENVLLHENRAIKLTDFGIADMLDPSMSAMTATGQILGSPNHMAPGQVEGGDTDARSDIFAVGTILYWLCTGVLPFAGKNPHQVLKRVVDCQPSDPLRLKPVIGHALRDIILRCLAKAPADRYQRAEDLTEALTAWLRTSGIEDSHQTLEAYLAAPEAEGARLHAQVLSALLQQAKRAVAARERGQALSLLDRALAMQDGHPEALRLLHALDRAARTRLALRGLAGGVAGAMCVALWGGY
jgi:eukaryotic-like serine/threonine-protein kinase